MSVQLDGATVITPLKRCRYCGSGCEAPPDMKGECGCCCQWIAWRNHPWVRVRIIIVGTWAHCRALVQQGDGGRPRSG